MLRIHFLNVGHGDCTIIRHPSGRLSMIDINNSQDFDADTLRELVEEERRAAGLNTSLLANALGLGANSNPFLGATPGLGSLFAPPNPLMAGSPNAFRFDPEQKVREKAKTDPTDPIAFIKAKYPNQRLWRFILTHPDLDHMRGIKRLHDEVGFTNFWDTRHGKEITDFRGGADKDDWEFYQSLRGGSKGITPRYYTRGDSHFAYGRDESGNPGGDNIEILSPTPQLVKSCNEADKFNDLSIVLRVHHAGRSVLLPGDAEGEAWNHMREHYGTKLKSCFLKASHHGRDSGYDLEALKLIAPVMTFVSVGQKPDTDASNKYRQQTAKRVASTRYYGNITLEIAGNGSFEWFVQRNAATQK